MRKIVAIALIVCAGSAQAQSAKEAIRAFARMDAHIESGMNFTDYTRALGDVNFEFKQFLDGPEADRRPEVKARLGAALGHYATAASLWQSSLSAGGAIHYKELNAKLTAAYPELAQSVFAGGATIQGGGLLASKVLPIYWRQAADEIAAAKKAAAIK